MGSGLRQIDKVKFVEGLAPQTPSSSTPDYVSLKHYKHLTIVIQAKNATTVTGSAITLKQATDVAATDPGVVDGASAGLHALVGGSLMFLDGQRSTRVPGSFGSMTDQASAALSRDGHDVASVVTLRPGAPDSASSLWIGAKIGRAHV